MDEVREETGNDQAGRPHTFLTVVLVMVVIYLFFPVIYGEPFHLVYGNSYPAPIDRFFQVFFAPTRLLMDLIPVYNRLIGWECDLLGIK